ncbi:amidohydrolase family protein [Aliifodinibius sp. S!AR15-10]|uniref:amidohydrolase family protein n=1 Tax=Aliifodinibius sp. S!AR15-10 TaxID=2950437 RepID=UPI0028575866|nr:amidohydrolase family protein [Aliifodinibius sp. S!AR15-10]MDR8390091.1 amidohydrolase family protein [Aliifodinibius sp. S!AR15-10]
MIKRIFLSIVILLSFTSTLLRAQIAVRGETIHTMNGEPIQNGVILVSDEKIEAVGSADEIQIPNNYDVHEASVVTPGLIDAHTVVGLAGIYNLDSDQDQLDDSDPIQPQLRAIDAYNAREELVKFVLDKGVTTVHTGHGPGAIASGQTMIAKTPYQTVEEAVIDSATTVAFTLGSMVDRYFDSPGTRAKGVAMLRQTFIKAREYAEKRNSDDPPSKDLKMEALADILDGKLTAMITAHQSQDIMTALRLKEEFGFEMILDGAAEAYLLIDEIRDAGVPVFIHPTMVRTSGDTKNASFTTAAKLAEAGIPFAFQSGFESYVPKTRIILYEAAIAVANGLPREAALRAMTIQPAQLLNIEKRVGSIAVGKDADIVLFDGDPFEYTTHISTVIVDGKVVNENDSD